MENITQYLDFGLVGLIVLSAYWLRANFSEIFVKVPMKFKVLILSTIISCIYAFIMSELLHEKVYLFKLVVSYFTATSFYELGFKPIEDLIKKYTK